MIKKLITPIVVALLATLLVPGVRTVYAEEGHIQASIDIKPGSYPNAINITSNGVIPVALLGSATFDVYTVDINTVEFGPMSQHMHGAGARPVRYAYEDVNNDGLVDLIFNFKTQDTGLQRDDTEACLHGTFVGGHFCGHDTVKVIG